MSRPAQRSITPRSARCPCVLRLILCCILVGVGVSCTGCAGTARTSILSFTDRTEFSLVRVIDDDLLRRHATTRADEVLIDQPASLAVLPGPVLLIADPGVGRIGRFDIGPLSQTTEPVRFSRALFQQPRIVRVDALGHIYVSASTETRIAVLDPDLRHAEWLQEPPIDGLGLLPPRLTGIAFGTLGDMYVADETNGRVYRYDATGTYLSVLGSEDDPWSRLERPAGVTVSAVDGSVYVCDPELGRVVVFDATGATERLLEDRQMRDPRAVAVGADGSALVLDGKSESLFVFSSRGKLIRTVRGTDLTAGGLAGPTDLVLSDSTLWIADPPGGRILEVRVREIDQ